MPSPVEICNAALALVGAKPVTSIEAPASKAAQLCATLYPTARDAVLEARAWRWATGRHELAADAEAPAYGPAKRFALPAEVLVVREASDGAEPLEDWQQEGRFITSSYAGPVFIRSTDRVEDTARFSPGFVEALTCYLAYQLAVPLAENRSLKADLWQEYQAKLARAGAVDGSQGRGRTLDTTSWLRRVRG